MRPRMFAAVVLLLGCTAGVAAQTAPAGVVEYYHVDALGSVRAVTSATGAVVRTHHYHPFGEGVESGADPMRFTGKPRDGETGLDYFGARYYASRTGRFTTVDPAMSIEAASVDPQRWNRYAYTLNNPARYVDPDGRDIVVALNRSLLQQAKEFREAVSKRLGRGVLARTVDRLIAPFVPATPREVADQALTATTPLAMAAGPTSKLAAAFGFTDFFESGSLVGGSLRNGATAMVSFVTQGNTLAVNISSVAGPSGTLAALEAGAIRAATSEGATTVKLIATNASDAMARLLRSQGFVRAGEGSTWVKEILVRK